MFLALMEGVGEGCDYTIGCNKEWHFLEATEHDEAIEELKGIFKYYGGDERVSKFTLIPFDGKEEIEAAFFVEAPERVRGCKHLETSDNFCSKCGSPMWKGEAK